MMEKDKLPIGRSRGFPADNRSRRSGTGSLYAVDVDFSSEAKREKENKAGDNRRQKVTFNDVTETANESGEGFGSPVAEERANIGSGKFTGSTKRSGQYGGILRKKYSDMGSMASDDSDEEETTKWRGREGRRRNDKIDNNWHRTLTCYTCGNIGHISRYCPRAAGAGAARKLPIEGYKYSSRGHSSRPLQHNAKVPKKCYNCNQPGHFSRACPLKSSNDTLESTLVDERADNATDNPASDLTAAATEEMSEAITLETIKSNDDADDDTALSGTLNAEGMGAVCPQEAPCPLLELQLVNQNGKMLALKDLLLYGNRKYKEGHCVCNRYARCTCKKKTVVIMNRRITLETIRFNFRAYNTEVLTIHCSMDEHDRKQNLDDFQNGTYSIMLMMASEIVSIVPQMGNIDWVINYDLPPGGVGYNMQVNSLRGKGDTLIITSFFDESVDWPMAESLSGVLENAGQTIPVWLKKGPPDMEDCNETDVDGEVEDP